MFRYVPRASKWGGSVVRIRNMLKSLALAISSSAMTCAVAAPDVSQFGLDCKGVSVDGIKHTTTPIHYRMSIDVEHQTFCILPACDGLRQLGPVSDTTIRLFDEPLSTNYLVSTVDQKSGAYDLVMQSDLANIHVTGICTWTAFTPFPPDAKKVYPPFPRVGTHVVAEPPLPLP